MSESRLEKVGTIFSRITGLIRSGAMKPADRPIWYDVYAAFPPKHEPRYDRAPLPSPNFREIVYPEDFVRGEFMKRFAATGRFNLMVEQGQSISEKFVENFYKLKAMNQEENDEKVFSDTCELMKQEGYFLKPAKSESHSS